MKRILSILLAVLFVTLAAAGCKKADSLEGTYIVKEIDGKPIQQYFEEEMADTGITLEDYFEMLGITSLDEFMVLTLGKDGTASAQTAGEEASTGTWTQEGDKVTITIDGDAVTFTKDGGKLLMDDGDASYVFEKKS